MQSPWVFATGSVLLFAVGVAVGVVAERHRSPEVPEVPSYASSLDAIGGLTNGPAAFGATPSSYELEPEASAPPEEENEEDQDLALPELAERTLGFTVSVRAGAAYGAGTLIGETLILTAAHVLDGDAPAQVAFADGEWIDAAPAAVDRTLDLAVLAIAPTTRPPASLGSARGLRPGTEVVGVGSPRELAFTVQRGIVSYVGRRFGDIGYLQTDLPANPGSSGGPVVDGQGRLVGVMAFVLRDSEGIAFAIPIDEAGPLFAHVGLAQPQ